MKLWQASLAPKDFVRIARIGSAHGHGSKAESVRYAIVMQRARDLNSGAPGGVDHSALYARARASCVEMNGRWQRANQSSASQDEARAANAERVCLERWSFKCNEEHLDGLRKVRDRHGLSMLAEALRFCLYVQSHLDGGD